MMEALNQIVCRLGQDPQIIAALVNERSLTSDQLHNYLDILREREIRLAGSVAERKKQDSSLVFPNQDLRAAETLRLLAADTEYQNAKTNVDKIRQQLRLLDAEIELSGRRNNADQKIIALVTTFINAGMQQEVHGILSAYLQEEPVFQDTQINESPVETNRSSIGNGLKAGTNNDKIFLVLEARPSKSPGTVRAFCEGSDGQKVAVYAKNGNGQTLLRCLGKKVKIECTPGDKGLIAYKVEPVA